MLWFCLQKYVIHVWFKGCFTVKYFIKNEQWTMTPFWSESFFITLKWPHSSRISKWEHHHRNRLLLCSGAASQLERPPLGNQFHSKSYTEFRFICLARTAVNLWHYGFLLCSSPSCWVCEAAGRTRSAARRYRRSPVGPSPCSWSSPQSNGWESRCSCRRQTWSHTETKTVLFSSNMQFNSIKLNLPVMSSGCRCDNMLKC